MRFLPVQLYSRTLHTYLVVGCGAWQHSDMIQSTVSAVLECMDMIQTVLSHTDWLLECLSLHIALERCSALLYRECSLRKWDLNGLQL